MEGNYKQLVEFISSSSGVAVDEIERRIEAKQARLSGLISKEGAAQVVAAELGINLDRQFIKISQIVPSMRRINLVGKIINMFPVREFNKNGRSGKIGSFVLADETSNIRVVLWDENHISLISAGSLGKDSIVEITNASLRNGELHLTSFSEIKISNKAIDNIVVDKPIVRKFINNLNPRDNISVRAFILQMFEPKFFYVCPECKKKASPAGECMQHGKISPEKRALMTIVIDDGTDSVRAVIFSDQLQKIMNQNELEDPELFSIKKKNFLGREMMILGQVRRNVMYNNNELIVSDIKEVDLDELIVELEKKK